MKKWLTKKNVIMVSTAYILFVVVILLLAYFCDNRNLCEIREDKFPGVLINIFAPFLLVFIFSIITYKMPESIFQNWVNFAFWTIPILIILSLLAVIESNNGFGVEGVIGGAFDMLVLGVSYAAFVIVSIWKIAAAHDKLKK